MTERLTEDRLGEAIVGELRKGRTLRFSCVNDIVEMSIVTGKTTWPNKGIWSAKRLVPLQKCEQFINGPAALLGLELKAMAEDVDLSVSTRKLTR